MKAKIALIRGKFLNAYEMQIFEPLVKKYDITAFGSLAPYHEKFAFPVIKLPSPMDLPNFPKKMPILNRIFTDVHYLYGLEEKLRGFDIVHSAETYFYYTKQALNAKKKGYVKKVIATVLENIPFNNEGIWGRKELKRNARENLDHMIALTQRTKDTLILEGADEKKITVISHGINTEIFYPGKNGVSNKKNLTIMFAGRLEKYKGVYEILYAIKLLNLDKDLKDFNLKYTIVGDGSEKINMLMLEKKLSIDRIITHKNLEYTQMPEEYRKADIFLAPSKPTDTYQEQYCTALLEAQASGLPIVTTFSGGIPENLGEAGLIIGPGDFYSLKESIKEFILSTQKRLFFSKKARERALKIHDTKVIAKKLENLYQSLL
ncbi:MAG TPA: glycosyltransferase family 4 protein [Patescibacteria group bacterium]